MMWREECDDVEGRDNDVEEGMVMWREGMMMWREDVMMWREDVMMWREDVMMWREDVMMWREGMMGRGPAQRAWPGGSAGRSAGSAACCRAGGRPRERRAAARVVETDAGEGHGRLEEVAQCGREVADVRRSLTVSPVWRAHGKAAEREGGGDGAQARGHLVVRRPAVVAPAREPVVFRTREGACGAEGGGGGSPCGD